jgi:hypothetical protein
VETTEKIVEAYVRYVKGWATIPNLRCKKQKEIDLFAIDPVSLDRYHIETSVSISGSFSKLNTKPFDPQHLKIPVKAASARRTFGFYLQHKFDCDAVAEKLASFGCDKATTKRIIVTWDATPEALTAADDMGVEVWLFPALMQEIATKAREGKSYFSDDTLRTLTLFARSTSGKGVAVTK